MKIAIGTEKGGYLTDTVTGHVTGPHFPGWKVTAFGRSPDGSHLAAVGSNWFGVGVHRSRDWEEWAQDDEPPTYGDRHELSQIWTFATVDEQVYAGVADAGLFTSDDGGRRWSEVDALNRHHTRDEWGPGLGGLCAHRILTDGDTMWVAISAVGIFRSDDGGASWEPKNDGIPAPGLPDDAPRPEVGYCVHNLDHDPARPERMWRQEHTGVFRSLDGGDSWERIETGLPAGFGFVMRRDHASGRLFVVPLESDGNRVPVDGALRAYVSHDDGESWEVAGSGWDEAPTFTAVLRGAVDTDGNGTVAFGTTSGDVWSTTDAGDTWSRLDASFPRIGAVKVLEA